MNSAIKKEYPLFPYLFWFCILAILSGSIMTGFVFQDVIQMNEKVIGAISTISLIVIGLIGIPTILLKQNKKRESVFSVDQKNHNGKSVLYRSDYPTCAISGAIAVTVHVNRGVLNRLSDHINILDMTDRVSVDKVPDICVVTLVPEDSLTLRGRKVNGFTNGRYSKVESKEDPLWTARIIEHELVHVILMANKCQIDHHLITSSMGV